MEPTMTNSDSQAEFQRRKSLSGVLQTSPRRVHDILRAAIRDGALSPGERLSEGALIRQLATSRNAIREALQMLCSEGIVTRARRDGTTVIGGLYQIPVQLGVTPALVPGFTLDILEERDVPSTPQIRASLRLDDDQVGMIEHLYSVDGKPLAVGAAYYRCGSRSGELWETSVPRNEAFARVYGGAVGSTKTVTTAIQLEPRTCRLLGAPQGTPGLVHEQTMYDLDGVPRELAFANWRADLVSFVDVTY
jgi:GntR family transcriptional regulator